MWFEERCRLCGHCVSVCPEKSHHIDQDGHRYQRERCAVCGQCVGVCLHRALELNYRKMHIDEITQIAAKDIPYYRNSSGGVTISGGEPPLQSGFLKNLLAKMQQRTIQTAVDTALHVAWSSIEMVLDHVDLWLIDLKVMDPGIHQKYTGESNTRILANLKRLSQTTTGEIIIRIPMINGITATAKNILQTIGFMKTIEKIRYTELLPYHNFGEIKLKSLGLNKRSRLFQRPDNDTLSRCAADFRKAGFAVRI